MARLTARRCSEGALFSISQSHSVRLHDPPNGFNGLADHDRFEKVTGRLTFMVQVSEQPADMAGGTVCSDRPSHTDWVKPTRPTANIHESYGSGY